MPDNITRLLERSTPARYEEPDFDALIRKGQRRRVTQRAAVLTAVFVVLAAAVLTLTPLMGGPAPVVEDVPEPTGMWRTLPEGPLTERINPATLTTEDGLVIVWGGTAPPPEEPMPFGPGLSDGAVYDTQSRTWTAIPSGPIATSQGGWNVRFADDEFAVVTWNQQEGLQAAIYDLRSREWQSLAQPPIDVRPPEVLAWDGHRLIVWGGTREPEGPPGDVATSRSGGRTGSEEPLTDGAVYDSDSQTWQQMAEAPLSPRERTAWVWTGERLVVWGGGVESEGEVYDDGAVYDPETDSWQSMAPSPLTARRGAAATWTGSEMIVIGGFDPSRSADGSQASPADDCHEPNDCDSDTELGIGYDPTRAGSYYDGARYNPTTDRWTPIPDPPDDAFGSAFPISRMRTSDLIAVAAPHDHNPAHVYRPSDNRWTKITIASASIRLQLVHSGDQLAAIPGPWRPPSQDAPFEAWIQQNDQTWAPAARAPFDRRIGPAVGYTSAGLFVWGGANFDEADRSPTSDDYRTNGWIWEP